MKRKNIEEIQKFESLPKIIKLFSEQEIKNILELHNSLPVTVHNKKQDIIKKSYIVKDTLTNVENIENLTN